MFRHFHAVRNGEELACHAQSNCEAKPSVFAGPGACKACDCRGFRPTGKRNDVCAYCGHLWAMHR
jgi:hypothetical protein